MPAYRAAAQRPGAPLLARANNVVKRYPAYFFSNVKSADHKRVYWLLFDAVSSAGSYVAPYRYS